MKKGFLLLIMISIAFCACKKEEVKEQELIEEYLSENEFNFQQTESGLYYEILDEGSGNSPVAGDNITVHYFGELLDGTIFDSSYSGDPRTFSLSGGVIDGWIEAVPLLKRGGKGRFLMPSDLGYGRIGSAPNIPGNAPLLFEIELIDF